MILMSPGRNVSVITIDMAARLQQLNYFVSSGRAARRGG
jgi:hypothetical protein